MSRVLGSRVLLPGLLHKVANPPPHLSPGQTAAVVAALFHSSTVLQRQRSSRFETYTVYHNGGDQITESLCSSLLQRFNSYATRFRRKDAKRALLRDASIYLEHLLQGYSDPDRSESSSYASWFEKQYLSKNRKKSHFHTGEYHWESYTSKKRRNVKVFWTDSDSEEFDNIFGSAFGGQQDIYGSFCGSEFNRRYSRYRNKHSWDWKEESDNEHDTTENSSFTDERLALGLTMSGPLKLEEVKKAYRACALKWHPDRHQGSTKAFAEEKFKHCTAAYKAICDELAAAHTWD